MRSHFAESNKRIIPLLIKPTDWDKNSPHLLGLQFIDLTGYKDELKYSQGLEKLLKELSQEKSYYEYHKILLVKALKWQRQNQNFSLLLRGYNLEHMSAWLKATSGQSQNLPVALQKELIDAIMTPGIEIYYCCIECCNSHLVKLGAKR